jgi:hypothetical protein
MVPLARDLVSRRRECPGFESDAMSSTSVRDSIKARFPATNLMLARCNETGINDLGNIRWLAFSPRIQGCFESSDVM